MNAGVVWDDLIVDSTLYLGIHASFTAKEDLYDVLTGDILRYCNVLQVFFSSPRSLKGPRCLSKEDAKRSKAYMEDYSIKLFSHFPYIANFAKRDCSEALSRMDAEIEQLSYLVPYRDGRSRGAVVIHPGSASALEEKGVTKDMEEALSRVIGNLRTLGNEKLRYVAIENAAGEGSKLCSTLDELERVSNELPAVQFCLDTAHAFGAGMCRFYTREEVRTFFTEWDRRIGLKRLACIHLNDSLAPFGGRRDQHQRIGRGWIWGDELSGLCELLYIAGTKGIPLIGESSIDAYNDIPLLRSLYECEVVVRQ